MPQHKGIALMPLLICAATARELAALAPEILPAENKIAEMRPMAATLKGIETIFLATGVGIINAAMAIGFALGATLKDNNGNTSPTVDGILYAGLAGAFDLEKTPLCSIQVVEEEIWPEYGLNDGIRVTAKAFSHPLWERQSSGEGEDIYDHLPLADISAISQSPGKKAREWPRRASLTVAGVSASFNRRDTLWTLYHAELENMEGFAAAYAAARAEIPCVEIRAVSNKVGPRGKNEKDFDGAIAALGNILPELSLI